MIFFVHILGHVITDTPKDHEIELHVVMVCNWCLAILVILGGGQLFSYYEGWSFFDSVYYCYVTLTTIGFGDFVVLQKEQALQTNPFYIFICILYILISLCVVASALNLLVLKYLTMNTKDEKLAAEAALVKKYADMAASSTKRFLKTRLSLTPETNLAV